MEALSYKTFVWPHNPHTYREECVREAQYYTQDGETYYKGMGEMRRVISGEGAFFGADAFTQFRELVKVFEDGSAGNLEHPVWGIRYCYFTLLELIQEPKDNYVSYRFAFTQAKTNGEVPK